MCTFKYSVRSLLGRFITYFTGAFKSKKKIFFLYRSCLLMELLKLEISFFTTLSCMNRKFRNRRIYTTCSSIKAAVILVIPCLISVFNNSCINVKTKILCNFNWHVNYTLLIYGFTDITYCDVDYSKCKRVPDNQ